jgi:hypothetical protein
VTSALSLNISVWQREPLVGGARPPLTPRREQK